MSSTYTRAEIASVVKQCHLNALKHELKKFQDFFASDVIDTMSKSEVVSHVTTLRFMSSTLKPVEAFVKDFAPSVVGLDSDSAVDSAVSSAPLTTSAATSLTITAVSSVASAAAAIHSPAVQAPLSTPVPAANASSDMMQFMALLLQQQREAEQNRLQQQREAEQARLQQQREEEQARLQQQREERQFEWQKFQELIKQQKCELESRDFNMKAERAQLMAEQKEALQRQEEESRAERDRILKLDEDRNMKFLEALKQQSDSQATSSRAGPPGSLSARADSAFHRVRAFLSKMNSSDDLLTYLQTCERVFDANNVDNDIRIHILMNYFRQDVKDIIIRLPADALSDYANCRRELLVNFKVSPINLRSQEIF